MSPTPTSSTKLEMSTWDADSIVAVQVSGTELVLNYLTQDPYVQIS